jgi:ribosomal protein S18 acetylase RimI-like enzyme
MRIINSAPEDIATIFRLYDEGTAYQKAVAKKQWKGFERSLIELEIREKRQWKIMIGEEVACVFAVTFNDPFIWLEKDKDPAIYIHRIATNPLFRGNSFVKHIIAWAKDHAKENGKRYIRMDTGSGNDKLNRYYMDCGFNYLGVIHLGDTENLPEHYKGGSSSLFEIIIN